jgi:hypothetical protein
MVHDHSQNGPSEHSALPASKKLCRGDCDTQGNNYICIAELDPTKESTKDAIISLLLINSQIISYDSKEKLRDFTW